MTFWQRLWRVELIGLASLCIFAVALALLLLIEGLIMSPTETDSFDVAFLTFILTFIYGFLPVTLFGAPLYAAAIASGSIRFVPMLIVAALPGCLFFLFGPGLGFIGSIAGICVFLLVHTAYRRFVVKA